ncbi:MAG: hypothetical protein D6761_04515 [Candidatus Dadabacteria bacterium]|nr:MAG: hypothetical protein D6761_04515 [Candidatus Dadabacteria bacterium]
MRWLALVFACAVSACTVDGVLDASAPDVPEGVTGRIRDVRPEVRSVVFSRNPDGLVDVIVQFSVPMDRFSVEAAIAVLAAEQTVYGRNDGTAIEPEGAFRWREDSAEVLFQVQGDDRPLVLVIDASARGQNGLEIDGAADERAENGESFHRFEDDGFVAPATYVSLPFYPQGTTGLDTHPQFLLSRSRPGLRCRHAQLGDLASGGASLGTMASDGQVACELYDRRSVPQRNGIAERKARQLFDPAAVPEARFIQDGVTVPAEVTLGQAGLPVGTFRVLATSEGASLRVASASFTTTSPAGDVLFAVPAQRDAPIWPVTAIVAPDVIWFAVTQATGVADSTDVPEQLVDVPGAAWVASEFDGQWFVREDNARFVVADNGGSTLRFASKVDCVLCGYRIETRTAGYYAAGNPDRNGLRLTSDQLQIRPSSPLAPGTWRLEIEGGRDLLGLQLTDGVRDGDEISVIRDDVIEYTVVVEGE